MINHRFKTKQGFDLATEVFPGVVTNEPNIDSVSNKSWANIW